MRNRFLLLAAGLALGCQPQASTQETSRATDSIHTPAVAVSAAGNKPNRPREADIIAKDTLNAVQDEVIKKTSSRGEAGFQTFFQSFEAIIQQQDAAAFNQLIDAQRGLYTIETTGAVPSFYLVKDIAQHRLSNFNKPFFSIRETFKNCILQKVAAFPKIDCEGDNDAYAQKGCFVTDGAEFQQQRIHQYASLSEAQTQAIEKTLPLVSKAVLHTASGYKFYFGQINGHWKVLFINLMAPCSA